MEFFPLEMTIRQESLKHVSGKTLHIETSENEFLDLF